MAGWDELVEIIGNILFVMPMDKPQNRWMRLFPLFIVLILAFISVSAALIALGYA